MLPRVKIIFQNGALGLVSPTSDGVLGLLCTGAAVASTFALTTPYILRGIDSLTTLGVTNVNNPSLFKIVSEFYAEAGNGAELWLMAFPDTVKMSDMVSVTESTYGKALVVAANGRLSGIIISRTPAVGYTPTITNGMDADVLLTKTNAELFAKWAADEMYAPVFAIMEGYAYSGNPIDLLDQTTGTASSTSIMIGDTVNNSKNAAIGLLAGRIAKNSIAQNVAAVEDGGIATSAAFIGNKTVEKADVASIHDKGYITFRKFMGLADYYFNDDFTCTKPTDDYCHLTARRTVNKAFRIAYNTLLPKILSKVYVNADGTMQAAILKSWQSLVEKAIANEMSAKGELSADITKPNDKGVKCFIDAMQNVAATSRFVVSVSVRPFAYPRYIDVPLGFQVVGQ